MTDKEKIMEWHKLVVTGLVNGLSHTNLDGRTNELEFWRQRSLLFNYFGFCVMDLFTKQDCEIPTPKGCGLPPS